MLFPCPTDVHRWLQQRTSPCWSKTASHTQISTFTGQCQRKTCGEIQQQALISICKHTLLLCAIISNVCLPSSPRRNILPHINSSYLKRCEFNRTTDPDCPIFRLKHIVSEAGEEFQDIAVKVCPEFNVTLTFQTFQKCHACLQLYTDISCSQRAVSSVLLLTGAVTWTGGQGSVTPSTASAGWTTNILSIMWPQDTTSGETTF